LSICPVESSLVLQEALWSAIGSEISPRPESSRTGSSHPARGAGEIAPGRAGLNRVRLGGRFARDRRGQTRDDRAACHRLGTVPGRGHRAAGRCGGG